jgi:transposase
LFVARDDHIEGLTYLLTLGVRVFTVLEFVLRRSLQDDQARLPDLYPANGTQMTDPPTAEQILKAFQGVSLSILQTAAGKEIQRWLTSFSVLQQDILHRLGLAVSLY